MSTSGQRVSDLYSWELVTLFISSTARAAHLRELSRCLWYEVLRMREVVKGPGHSWFCHSKEGSRMSLPV